MTSANRAGLEEASGATVNTVSMPRNTFSSSAPKPMAL